MRSKKIKATILTSFFFILISTAFVYPQEKEKDKGKEKVRCHKCKEKDIKLVFRHRQLGYDGCFICHGYLLEKEKEKESDKKNEATPPPK